MEKKIQLTCIGCPMGCQLTVALEEGPSLEVLSVSGNTCPRGDTYARKEVTNPTRIVTSSLPVSGGNMAMVSCKTGSDIPKDKIFAVTEAMRGIVVEAPVAIGDVLISNIAETGVDLIATRRVDEKKL